MDERTDRRIKRTRSALKNAYIQLLERFSDEKITVLMITQYANVNRATFYCHFSNKPELLKEMLYDVLEGLKNAILTAFKNEKIIKVSGVTPTTIGIFDYIEKNKKIFHALYFGHEDFKHHVEELFINIFSDNIHMDIESPMGKVNYEMYIHYQTSATLGLIFYWIQTDFQFPSTFMIEQLTMLTNTEVINLRKF
ncbi:TetR/AcrR family transcriptional regulator [Neobacillus sp. FSL H8-0543]|uniref:TetR/AcrR family transcriptional regulator n=1 Tax=Neobacillus sp. FSL H8-0543 TaxID=2954672 RepID=UPI0031588C65